MKHKIRIKQKSFSYDIHFTSQIETALKKILKKLGNPIKILLVIDSIVFRFHSKKIQMLFQTNGSEIHYFIFRASEIRKSISVVQDIHRKLSENSFSKDSLLVAIGGGITGDISGFAASTYMRGIPLIHIPTTITSMVDSAIGGKSGVNFLNSKNLIGTIYQPKTVLIDIEFLTTLPKKEIRSGLGEVIKYGYLSNKIHFDYLNRNLDKLFQLSKNHLSYVIKECIGIKSAVVETDESDEGLRKILNFGHTFGHAFESASDFKIKHGEAVVAGIVAALFLSFQLGYMNKIKLNELQELPIKFGIPQKVKGLSEDKIFRFMKMDKKNRKNELKFILIKDIGELLLDINANKSEVFRSVRKLRDLV